MCFQASMSPGQRKKITLNHLNIKWFRALPKSHIISYFLFLFRNIFHHSKATELSQRESSKHVLLNKHVPGTLLKKNEAL